MSSQFTPTSGRKKWGALAAAIAASVFAVPLVAGPAAEASGTVDITLTVADHTYDGSTGATITLCTVDTDTLGDDVGCSASTGDFATANVGTGISVTGTDEFLTGADAGNWTIGSVTAVGDIVAADVSVDSVTVTTKTYDGTTAATIDSCTLSGAVGGDDVGCSATGSFDSAGAGASVSVTIDSASLTGTAAGNYSLSSSYPSASGDIDALELAVTAIDADPKDYDGTTDATVSDCTLVGIVGTDDVTCSGTGTFDDATAGTGKTVTVDALSLGSTDSANYTLGTYTGLTDTAAIDPIELTVTGITADNKDYDSTTDATISDCTLDGVVEGDDVTCSGTGTFDDASAGTGKTVTATDLTLGGADNGNYTLADYSSVTTTADIDPLELTVTPDDQEVTYGDAAPAADFYTFDVTGFLAGEDATDPSYVAPVCGSDYAQGDGTSVSPLTISCTGGSMDNYDVNVDATADLTINAVELTVTPDDATITYGDNAPDPLTYTVDGFVNGDSEASEGFTAPTCTADYTAGDRAGRYAITCNGGSLDGYEFTYGTAWLTVEALTVPADATWYTGPTEQYTASATDTLTKVTLSATLTLDLIDQDGGQTCADTAVTVADARVTFSDQLTGKVIAKDVPFSEVDGNCEEGIASTVATISTGTNGAEAYVIVATLGGSMSGSNADTGGQLETDLGSATLTVALPRTPGTVAGIGELLVRPKVSLYDLGTSGSLTTAMDGSPAVVSYRFVPGTRKTLPKGQAVVIIPAAEGGYYYIKSNSITSVTVGTTTTSVYTKASVTLVGGTCATTCAIDGGVILRLDSLNTTPYSVAFTVQSAKTSALYYSNHWVKSGKVWTSALQELNT